MKRWHQGHSLGSGVLVGVLLADHAWLLFVAGVVAGIAIAYMKQTASWFAGAYRQHRANGGAAKRERIITEPVPVYQARAPRVAGQLEDTDPLPY